MRSVIKDRPVKGTHILADDIPRDRPGRVHIVECHKCRENVGVVDGAFKDVAEEGGWKAHRHQPAGWMPTWNSGNSVSKAKLAPKDYWGV